MSTKKLLASLLGVSMLLPATLTQAASPIKLTIDGKNVVFTEAAPFIDSHNRTLIPLRFVSENLGANVKWDSNSKTVTAVKNDVTVSFKVNDPYMKLNNKKTKMDTQTIQKNNTVYIPLKYIETAFNVSASFDAKTSTVSITTPNENDVILTVDGHEFYSTEFISEYNYQLALLKQSYGDSILQANGVDELLEQIKTSILDNMINNHLALEKAPSFNINISDAEVNTLYTAEKNKFKSENEFKAVLNANSLTESSFKNQIKNSLLINAVEDYLTKDVTVTDQEAKTYYDTHKDSFTLKAGATMSHILVDTEEKALEIKKAYEAGTSFEDLAKKYGTDGTKDNGGLLGYIPYSSTDYDQDFLNGAKVLKEGEVSAPIKTQFGWHLIKVTNVHPTDGVYSFSEVKATIISALKDQKSQAAISNAIEDWRKTSKIEINTELINQLIH